MLILIGNRHIEDAGGVRIAGNDPVIENTTHTGAVSDYAAASGHHDGPYIPSLKGEAVKFEGSYVFPEPLNEWITTTVLSTWVLMIALFVFAFVLYRGLRSGKGKRKMAGLTIVRFFDSFFVDLIGDRAFTRKVLFILGGFFIYIIFANIFGLMIDMLSSFLPFLHKILRPTNADLNTTFGMAAMILILSHIFMVKSRGVASYIKGYLFHWEGSNIMEKCIQVFVGWLHGIGELVRLISLSFRLYGNIFAGLMLITILVYLTSQLSFLSINFGELLIIPFWFFELFVAGVQTLVFCVLSAIYFQEAIQQHH